MGSWRRAKPGEPLDTDYCHVAVPLGIGDSHWALMKLRALRDRVGMPLCVHVNESSDHATVGYLNMVPFVDKAICSQLAPYGLPKNQVPPSHLSGKWATLRGSANWNGLHYLFAPNGHLELGRNIRGWMPSLETEWNVEVTWTDSDRERSEVLMPEPTVLCYLSGTGPNRAFHGGWWSPQHWANLVVLLNENGIVPIAVGADTSSDHGYMTGCAHAFMRSGARIEPLVGKTTIPDYLLLIRRCSAWVGLNSGGGIVSASMGTPTLMMWADKRYPVGKPHPGFHPGMQRAWIDDDGDPEKTKTYRTLSYGSPDMTPENAARMIVEMAR